MSIPLRRAVAVVLAAYVAVLPSCSTSSADGPISETLRSDTRPSVTTTEAPPTSNPADSTTPSAADNGFPDDWVPEPLQWRTCSTVQIAGECAALTVPLDWSEPDGDTISLEIGRTTASGDRIGSVLVNPGGPGASGLRYLSSDPLSANVTERFDVVSWDPRGIGASTPLSCGAGAQEMLRLDPTPDSPAEQAELDRAAAVVSDDCGRTDSAMLAQIGTWNVARDMEAIRRALGDEPLNYVGFSYGTHIGQAYAELFPRNIRTMVLDGVVDPSLGFTGFLLGQTKAFDEAFERNAAACAVAGEGTCGVPDLGAAFDEVARRVEIQPLGSGSSEVGPAELATAAILTSYVPDGWEQLGPALAQALEGQGGGIRSLADSYYDFGSYAGYAAVVCTDSKHPDGAAEFRAFADEARQVSPRLGGSVANEMLPCATWPVEPMGAAAPLTAPGAPPILVIGNTGDAATPYADAVRVADTLESGVLVTADITGHTAYSRNACVAQVVDAYLVYLTVPTSDPRCT